MGFLIEREPILLLLFPIFYALGAAEPRGNRERRHVYQEPTDCGDSAKPRGTRGDSREH